MRPGSSATDILRRHCIERRLRRAVPSLDPSGEPKAVPHMSHEAWVDSLALVRGVPERVLEMLERFHCDDDGTEWTTCLVEIQGQEAELRKEQVARPLKLAAAAQLAGLDLDHRQARALQLGAIGIVTDNMIRRVKESAA